MKFWLIINSFNKLYLNDIMELMVWLLKIFLNWMLCTYQKNVVTPSFPRSTLTPEANLLFSRHLLCRFLLFSISTINSLIFSVRGRFLTYIFTFFLSKSDFKAILWITVPNCDNSNFFCYSSIRHSCCLSCLFP